MGGVQDPGSNNNIQLLFYKQDRVTQKSDKGYNADYLNDDFHIEVEVSDEEFKEKDYESLLNQLQLQKECSLRSLISFDDRSGKKTHFLIMQRTQTDCLYVISKYPGRIIQSYASYVK